MQLLQEMLHKIEIDNIDNAMAQVEQDLISHNKIMKFINAHRTDGTLTQQEILTNEAMANTLWNRAHTIMDNLAACPV